MFRSHKAFILILAILIALTATPLVAKAADADTQNKYHARAILLLANGRNDRANKDQPLNMENGGRRGARIPLRAVGGAPFKSGSVVDTFTEGPQNYAIERYQLNGGEPNTTYQIQLVIHLGNDSCSGTPIIQPSVPLTTNQNGNGQSSIRVPPEFIPPVAFDRVNSLSWQLLKDGVVRYETACTAIFEDLP
jgi:hypothetical protein